MLRRLSIFFVARIVSAFIAFLSLTTFARVLSPAEFAVYSLIFSTAYLLNTFMYRWITTSLTRFHSDEASGGEAVPNALRFFVFVTLGLFVAGAFAAALGDASWALSVGLTTLLGAALGLFDTAAAILRVEGAARRYAIADIGRTLAGFAFGTILAVGGFGPEGVIAALIVAATVLSLNALRGRAARFAPLRIDRRALAIFLRYGGALTLAGACAILIATTSRYLMAGMVGLQEAGYFIAAATLCERTVRMLMINLSTTVAPSVFEAQETDAGSLSGLLEGYFVSLCIVATPLVLVFVFANDTIAMIMLGEEIGVGAARYLPYLAVTAALLGLQQAYYSFQFTIPKQTTVALALAVVGTLMNAAIVYLMILRFGSLGAALGSLVGAILILGSSIVVGRRYLDIPDPTRAAGRAVLASAAPIPLMIWAETLESAPAAFAVLCAAAAATALAAIAFDVPMARRIAGRVVATARRRIGR